MVIHGRGESRDIIGGGARCRKCTLQLNHECARLWSADFSPEEHRQPIREERWGDQLVGEGVQCVPEH